MNGKAENRRNGQKSTKSPDIKRSVLGYRVGRCNVFRNPVTYCFYWQKTSKVTGYTFFPYYNIFKRSKKTGQNRVITSTAKNAFFCPVTCNLQPGAQRPSFRGLSTEYSASFQPPRTKNSALSSIKMDFRALMGALISFARIHPS